MDAQRKQFGCLSSLLLLFVTFAIAIALLATKSSELLVRSIGGSFQFLGIVLIAWGIRDLRIEFNVPTWREGLRTELAPLWGNVKTNWRRWWHIQHDTRVLTGSGSLNISGSASMTAAGHVELSPSIERQLELLKAAVEEVKSTVRELKQEVARNSEQVARDIAAEAARRAELKAELDDKIASLAVGGLRLETVGVCWLFAGTVLATWPCEIASWLGAAC